MEQNKKKDKTTITAIGNLFGSSGYASHFRGLVNELNKLTECKLVTGLPVGFERDVNDQELEMIKREQDFDINLIITHPLHWKSNLSAKRNWVYLIFEGDSVPKWIVEECRNEKIEKIIVPSHHTLLALTTSLKDDPEMKEILYKTKLIPHGHDPKIFYSQQPRIKQGRGEEPLSDSPCTPPMESSSADTFKFLANKGLRNLEDRGGIQYLIEAYLSEFTESDPVELILKINPAYGVPNLLKMFPNIKDKGVPKITFIPKEYTTKELNELYNECDVFVSPTRAEAFNLPCLEAMACGKPVITTNFGGQTDYVKHGETGIIIGGKLTEVTHEIEYEGIKWLTPDIDELKKQLRLAYKHRNIIEYTHKDKCLEVAKSLTWANTAKQIHSLL